MAKVTRQRQPRPIKKSSKGKQVLRKTQTKKKEISGFNPPIAVCLYGPGGVGKTSLCGYFPKPRFIIGKDQGVNDLVDYKQIPEPQSIENVTDWDDLLTATKNSVEEDCGSVIFDNLTDFEGLCFESHCERYFDGDWSARGFYSFMKGPKNAAKVDWPEFLLACQSILDAGKNVVIIAHSRIKTVPNPAGEDWLQYEPEVEAAVWKATHYWAKATLYYGLHTETKKDGNKVKAASGDFNRFIFTEPSPTYVAKNRFGLPAIIDCGDSPKEAFDALYSAFNK